MIFGFVSHQLSALACQLTSVSLCQCQTTKSGGPELLSNFSLVETAYMAQKVAITTHPTQFPPS